ncbi:hypothetical protein E3N88_46153 [Mikania micrantha]|uniref:Transmembrane protein n=1 Tax=Mikania micrantha TaxID=192012 RepID=A0A5N6L723_9ASTR|nr:hypothetical protein E3N88_46153 [Mikania micrantha]
MIVGDRSQAVPLTPPSPLNKMAHFNIVKKASAVLVIALAAVTTVSGQEFALAPAPAPSAIAGSSFSLPASGVMVATSLVITFVALLRK